ncbi:MAG: hypothetical protein OXC26_22855, partial [Albidovulum sp.]|nr:hypothetical protein [Albidovulum sp.]
PSDAASFGRSFRAEAQQSLPLGPRQLSRSHSSRASADRDDRPEPSPGQAFMNHSTVSEDI